MELKTLAKSLQINCSSLKKHDIADAIVKHSQRPNVSNFFMCASDTTEKMVLKRFVSVCFTRILDWKVFIAEIFNFIAEIFNSVMQLSKS